MLLKYVDVKTNLEVYEKYFNQLMSELNSENDRNKKIYVLKNDLKKFQDKFQTDRLILLIKLMIEQKSFKESMSVIMNQCQIQVKNKLLVQDPTLPLTHKFESFQHLNDYL